MNNAPKGDAMIYWRLEWHQSDILSSPALNTGWIGLNGHAPTTHDGLSACRTAQELIRYFEPFRKSVEAAELASEIDPDDEEQSSVFVPRGMSREDAIENVVERAMDVLSRKHRCPDEDSRVVAIEGDEIGRGQDGEPLIIPRRVVAETTYGELVGHPNLNWLDVREVEDLPGLLFAKPVQPRPETQKYIIGGFCVRMTRNAAAAWNEGSINDGDLAVSALYDAGIDEWISLFDACKTKIFGQFLEGSVAEEQEQY